MSASGSKDRHGTIHVVPETDGIVAVCLEGEFDLANAPALGEHLDRALDGGNHVIVDLSEATFIDSSVVYVLTQASRAAAERKQVMVLQVGTSAIVERVLQLVGIEDVMPRGHDWQESVRIIQNQASKTT